MTLPRSSRRRLAGFRQQMLLHEEKLLDPEVRGSSSQLLRLIHPDFLEFGSSGRSYDRQGIIDSMVAEKPAGVVIRDFEAKPLAPDVALVTYRSIGASGTEARRSSVWLLEDDEWRIVFHQGTRIADSWGTIG